jgi:hypothetical protein
MSQVYIPSLVVVYVACRIRPADKPEYNAKTPSFLSIADVIFNVDVFVPLNCMRFFIKSNGCTKHVAAILQLNIYLINKLSLLFTFMYVNK